MTQEYEPKPAPSPDQLISQADSYLKEVSRRRLDLREIRRLAGAGKISDEILEREVRGFQQFLDQATLDSDLQRGIELRRERLERERQQAVFQPPVETPPVSVTPEAERVLPKIIVDDTKREIYFPAENRAIIISGKILWVGFMAIARMARQDIPTEQLDEIAKNAGSKDKNFPGAHLIKQLRRHIEVDPKNPQFLTRTGPFRNSIYRLNAQVEFVEEAVEIAKPVLVFSKNQSQIIFDGESIHLTARQLAVLQVLAKNLGQQILSRQLSYDALGNPDPAKANLRDIISRLQYKINPQTGEPFLVSKMGANRSWHMLQGVEAVWPKEPEEPKEPKKPKEFPPPLHPSRLEALTILLLGEASVDQIRQVLGPDKSDRQLTDQRVSWSLIGSINKLYGRVRNGIANDQELELWDAYKKEITKEKGITEDRAILDYIRERIKLWVKGEDEVELPTPDWDLLFGQLSSQEALVLTLLLEYNQDLLAKYQLSKLPQELSEEIKARIPTLRGLSEEELNQLRVESLLKVRDIVRGEKLDKFYDLQDPEIQTLLIYFMEVDSQGAFDLIEELLKIPDQDVKEQLGKIKQLENTDLQTVRDRRQMPTLPSIGGQEIQAPVAIPYEPPVEKPRERKIEKRDPEVRQKINNYLDQIEELKITGPVTGDQLTRFFPSVKLTNMESAIEKGYIKPGKGRDHHEVFGREEIAVLLYVRHSGNNLSSRLIKELTQIVREEIAKREKENGNSSSK